jgi:DNA repair ATPase RecN
VSKYTNEERTLVKSIVANLTIKRIPDNEIFKEVFNQTNKTISRSGLYNVRQQIKRDSYKWYQTLRQGEYEYIHEFKERINEIMWLQKKHNEIIKNKPEIQQTSLAELHKLNITLSNYFDVAPTILNIGTIEKNDNTISNPQQDKEIIV